MQIEEKTGYFVAVYRKTDSPPPSMMEGGYFQHRLAKTNIFLVYFLQKILILWEGSNSKNVL